MIKAQKTRLMLSRLNLRADQIKLISHGATHADSVSSASASSLYITYVRVDAKNALLNLLLYLLNV